MVEKLFPDSSKKKRRKLSLYALCFYCNAELRAMEHISNPPSSPLSTNGGEGRGLPYIKVFLEIPHDAT